SMVEAGECLFCRIARGEIPAKKVYEDASVLAFLDINPRNPGHTLVVPKKHAETLFELPDGDVGGFFMAVKKVAVLVRNGTQAQGVSLNMSNGQAAGQVVAHAHMHVIPRFLSEGPPGLESILSVKKMDDQLMDKIAAAIKAGNTVPAAAMPRPAPGPTLSGGDAPAPAKREEPKPDISFDEE
ncbi:MAG TPA: HIT family protein, partial [archaeon]|nr:HIT family protein [archaeon]